MASWVPPSAVQPTITGFVLQSSSARIYSTISIALGFFILTAGCIKTMLSTNAFVRRRLGFVLGIQLFVFVSFLYLRLFQPAEVLQLVISPILLVAVAGFVWALRYIKIAGIPSKVILTLFDISPVPTILIDASSEMVVLNPAAREVLGHVEQKPDKIVQSLGLGSSAITVLTEQAQQHRVAIKLGPAGNRIFDAQVVYHAKEKSGLIQLLEVTEGEIGVEEAMAKIQKFRERVLVQEKMAAVGNLVSGLAHEINNPLGFLMANLNVIKEYQRSLSRGVQLVKEKKGPAQLELWAQSDEVQEASEDFRDVIEECMIGCQRIQGIIAALTSLNRKSQPAVATDLAKLAKDAVSEVKNQDLDSKQLRTDISTSLPVSGIPADLTQAIIQLVQNALQAVDEQGLVTVTAWSKQETAVVEVADNGPGISTQYQARIFEPFFTTKPISKNVGLGLTYAYEVATVHCGEVRVESEKGHGARFQLRIPLEKPHQPETLTTG